MWGMHLYSVQTNPSSRMVSNGWLVNYTNKLHFKEKVIIIHSHSHIKNTFSVISFCKNLKFSKNESTVEK